MAVPNTTTFTLQDVVDEVGPTTNDLADCFSDSTDSNFVSSHKGSKDRLSNFRGYIAATVTDVVVSSFLINSGSYYVFSVAQQPFSQLSSDAFIRTEWRVSWYNFQYRYSYSISYSKNYTFTNENNLASNSQINIYQYNAYPQYLMFYDNIDLDSNDSANIINV